MATKPSGKKPAPSEAPNTKTPAAPKPGAAGASAPDWERIELDYRAGIKTLRQIADENGISHVAINKRAKRDDWSRDLSAKIQAKADELVTKRSVTKEVTKDGRVAEKEVIDAAATAVANIRIGHRKDIRRLHVIVNSLLDELEHQAGVEAAAMLSELGEIMREPDESGQDKRNDLYRKIISLTERSKTAKTLADTMRVAVDMERQAFNMDAKGADGTPGAPGYIPPSISVSFVSPPRRDEDEAEE